MAVESLENSGGKLVREAEEKKAGGGSFKRVEAGG